MNIKRFIVILGVVCLAAVVVFTWGCQNQPTGPELSNPLGTKTRSYQSGSCTAGSFRVSYSGANFVTGLGWNSGSSRTINFSGSASGVNWGPGVYGWFRNPLVEYYIGNNGGSGSCGYRCNGRSYTLRTATRTNAPSIDGTRTFTQYLVGGSRSSPVDMGCHFNAWRNCGRSVGNQAYQVVMVESWSHGSGSARVSVSGSNWYTHWVGSGSASFSCGGGGGSTTTTTSGGGGDCYNYRLRARSTDGQGRVNLRVDDNQTIATFTLGTSMGDYRAESCLHGGINVQFFNDTDGRDVQIDYLSVDGDYRQAENQSYNTGVWQNGSCGGSNSEWMHCNGIIGFGDTPNPGNHNGGGGSSSSTTTTARTTTTSSGGWWWGGGGNTTTTASYSTTTTSGSSWWGGGSWW